MNPFEAILPHHLLHAFGWALLHFLWQGALIALLFAGILALLPKRASNPRYLAGCAALLLMLLLPVISFWRISSSAAGADVEEIGLQAATRPGEARRLSGQVELAKVRPTDAPAGTRSAARPQELSERLDALLPWLLGAWLLGVMALTVRLCGGIISARRLARSETRPSEKEWQERLNQLAARLRLTKTVRLLESAMIRVPATIGWWRPIILLPTSSFTGLTPRQLELILAHELAHIRRHDYLINLLQVATETILFYHPAVWWVSRQVRIEREHACDDLAVAVCGGDPLAYARALTTMERLRRETAPLLTVAVNGGTLSGRIQRLLQFTEPPQRSFSPFAALLLLAAFMTALAGAPNVLSLSHPKSSRSSQGSSPSTAPPRSAVSAQTHDPAPAAIERPLSADEVTSLLAADETEGEDAEVRRAAVASLGHRAGTVIVMDPRTGRVYTVVNQEWAVRRSWKPASIIKLVTSAAGVADNSLIPTERVRASPKAKALDLTEALARSDNAYFNLVGGRISAARLLDYARALGLGERTGINYAGESAGVLPPPALLRGDASRMGTYGDGIEVTPIQLATLVSAIGNGGTLFVPRVPRASESAAPFAPQILRPAGVSRTTLGHLTRGMIAAVSDGTGQGAFDPTQTVAGKTGTFGEDESRVGLFASYAPAEDPRLVVVVLTRGQHESGSAAASVAGEVYRALRHRAF